eukprot:scaffold721_cov131-Cylindrotheca_fusiformis.AAC.71
MNVEAPSRPWHIQLNEERIRRLHLDFTGSPLPPLLQAHRQRFRLVSLQRLVVHAKSHLLQFSPSFY